jgi:hypothetical protein
MNMDINISETEPKAVTKKIIGVQISDSLRTKLETEADSLGLSLSSMIRLILSRHYQSAKFDDFNEEEK